MSFKYYTDMKNKCSCRCFVPPRNTNPFITACIIVLRVTIVLQNLERCPVNPILHSRSTTPQFVISLQWDVVFRHQLFLPVSNNFRKNILHKMHESPTNGHSSLNLSSQTYIYIIIIIFKHWSY